MSESVGSEIGAALVAFQAECCDVVPNSTATVPTKGGGQYSYRYADLSTVLGELRPKLKKHGLAVLQSPADADGSVGIHTLIVHKSGEVIDAGTILLPMTQSTPQGAGACITYARRYALGAIAGIATDTDDDAAGHQKPQGGCSTAAPSPQRDAPSSGGGGSAFDTDIGFGKFKDKYTWRQMTEGTIGGERHDYLIYLAGKIDPKKDKWSKERLERVQKCLAVIGNRADTGAQEPPEEEGPPLPDDGAEGF